jgi:hypothetical protein
VLKSIFEDPSGFQAEQARSNAIVTGSVLRNVFKGQCPTKLLGLMIVVKKGNEGGMQTFLDSEGYDVDKTSESQDEVRYSRHDESIVTLVRTSEPPIMYIFCLPCSAMMNFATWCKMYSLWPNQTFRDERAYLFHHYENGKHTIPQLEEQLRMEGFKIRPDMITSEEKKKLTRLRYIGDDETWSVSLDPVNEPETAISNEVLEVSSFQYRQGHKDHMALVLRPLLVLHHPDLQHEYVAVAFFWEHNRDLCKAYDEIKSKLCDSYWKSYKEIPEPQRSRNWTQRTCVLGCRPHSWMEFWTNAAQEAFEELQTRQGDNINAHQVVEKREKKDEWFIEQVREVNRVCPRYEPE